MAFAQGAGVEPEEHSLAAVAIGEVEGQLGILTAYLARQCAAEHLLRILRSVDHTALQGHAGRVLTNGKEEGVQL